MKAFNEQMGGAKASRPRKMGSRYCRQKSGNLKTGGASKPQLFLSSSGQAGLPDDSTSNSLRQRESEEAELDLPAKVAPKAGALGADLYLVAGLAELQPALGVCLLCKYSFAFILHDGACCERWLRLSTVFRRQGIPAPSRLQLQGYGTRSPRLSGCRSSS